MASKGGTGIFSLNGDGFCEETILRTYGEGKTCANLNRGVEKLCTITKNTILLYQLVKKKLRGIHGCLRSTRH